MNVKNFDFSKVSVIIKTLKNYEGVVAQLIRENFPEAEVSPRPLNFSGLVLVLSLIHI